MRHFKGPARVYDSDEEAFEALISGKIYAGDVIVIRYAGPRGAPGLVEVMLTADALVDLGLDTSVGPVSYTHLDVYKRQANGCLSFWDCQR